MPAWQSCPHPTLRLALCQDPGQMTLLQSCQLMEHRHSSEANRDTERVLHLSSHTGLIQDLITAVGLSITCCARNGKLQSTGRQYGCNWNLHLQGILPGQAARARHICEALQTLMMRPLIPIEGRRQGYKAKRMPFLDALVTLRICLACML